MEWEQEKCLQLIAAYGLYPELWQATHKYYYNKLKKNDAWCEIAKQLESNVEIIKAKLNSLLASFRREKARQESTTGTGKGRNEIYRSKWFGFEAFQFLMDKSKCRKSLNTSQNKSKIVEGTPAEETEVKTIFFL
ncbi:hypothetical protein PPYR_04879 [Photinus pyralis]|uniref:MADF domain-containing protein n=1 Tax=Photinus pyralis TaxID=7054 RepID=A0A5N4AZH8_PHOPY|nr:hypothetical protein PPYR_04879 [Photinus pyralis]